MEEAHALDWTPAARKAAWEDRKAQRLREVDDVSGHRANRSGSPRLDHYETFAAKVRALSWNGEGETPNVPSIPPYVDHAAVEKTLSTLETLRDDLRHAGNGHSEVSSVEDVLVLTDPLPKPAAEVQDGPAGKDNQAGNADQGKHPDDDVPVLPVSTGHEAPSQPTGEDYHEASFTETAAPEESGEPMPDALALMAPKGLGLDELRAYFKQRQQELHHRLIDGGNSLPPLTFEEREDLTTLQKFIGWFN